MPSLGADLCGQVVFGGDPPWLDAAAVAAGRAVSLATLLRRVPQGAAQAAGKGRAGAALQRLSLVAAAVDASCVGRCRFVHLVAVRGETGGYARSGAALRRLVLCSAVGAGRGGTRAGMLRLVQCATGAAGTAFADGLFQRCPHFASRCTATSRAWFVTITVMGGATAAGELQRIAHCALEARAPSMGEATLMRLCPYRATGRGGARSWARASLCAVLCATGDGFACPVTRLAGTWAARAEVKAQALVEGSPALLAPLSPLPCGGRARARCAAHALALGIGPALSFPATAPASGVIPFEVQR